VVVVVDWVVCVVVGVVTVVVGAGTVGFVVVGPPIPPSPLP